MNNQFELQSNLLNSVIAEKSTLEDQIKNDSGKLSENEKELIQLRDKISNLTVNLNESTEQGCLIEDLERKIETLTKDYEVNS